MIQGTNSGYDGGQARSADTTVSRVGTQIWLKGISFDCMIWLKSQLLHCTLHVSLIRFVKGNYSTADNLYKNYTGVKELDMRDNHWFKTVKK